MVRPGGPQSIEADGQLVLYHPDTFVDYDFGATTTARDTGGSSLGGGQPVGGEEGYVHIHAGIHGIGDLDASVRDWRNPVAEITIVRQGASDN